jgi:muramoyltetrapeptide carboxypeptidase
MIESNGYKASFSDGLLKKDGQFAGNDDFRSTDFLEAWKNDAVHALWVARGGYGAQRIVDVISNELGSTNPKWVIGFSDTTAVHAALSINGYCSIHGPVLSTINQTHGEDIAELFRILAGESSNELTIPSGKWNLQGTATGRLVGGNLSVLQTMINTASMPVEKGDILFIEDVDEMLYHLDRMVLHLRRSGVLSRLSGILIGEMTDMRDNTIEHGFSVDNPYGKDAYGITFDRLRDLNLPVAFGLPCGHGKRNHPLIIGASVILDVGAERTMVSYV